MDTAPSLPPHRRIPSWLLPAVLVVVLGLGAWYALSKSGIAHNTNAITPAANTNATSASINGATNTNTASTSIPAGWATYSNPEYGFRLAFPPDWAGYGVAVTKNEAFGDNAGHTTRADVILFTHSKHVSAKGNAGEVDFSIEIYSDPSLPFASQSLLGTSGLRRFGFTVGNGAAPDELHDLYNMIPLIRDTFALQ